MSLTSQALDRTGRHDIKSFYGEVLGWREISVPPSGRDCLVLSAGLDQFIYLTADDAPMEAPHTDHFGMSVASLGELEGVYARACSYADHDPRVTLVPPAVEDHPLLKVHNMYVAYLLPMTIEIQYWDFHGAS
jgi:hypothetical protein